MKEKNNLILAYNRVFSTADGQLVLDDICLRGKLLESCETPQDTGRENLAKEIVSLAYSDEDGFVKCHKFKDLIKRILKRSK